MALLLSFCVQCGFAAAPPQDVAPGLPALPAGGPPISWERDVKPVLDARCVVCHGCYDAPCQLDLGSFEGVQRGATSEPVYKSTRLLEAPLTRLFEDAHTTEAWREKGFHPVVSGPGGQADSSLVLQALALGRAGAPTPGARLPEGFPLAIDRALSCPTPDAYGSYLAANPMGGMPYGMAPLSDGEMASLVQWVRAGTPPPAARPELPAGAERQRADWEAFLNGTSPREQLVARYLYEHWYIAHLYFDDLPTGPWFRVVRSSTPPGEPVRVIATRRPYDAPGEGPFWYRLDPIHRTILHKTHITYPLSAARMARLRALFLEPAWSLAELPGYAAHESANPFVTFDAIPVRARYQFLLDDAEHFVRTFIRGPVCRGQVATNVIRDRFWVAFVDPDWSPTVTDPTLMEEAKKLLGVPAAEGSKLDRVLLWGRYDDHLKAYLARLREAYDEIDPEGDGPPLDAVWDGDGSNPNALLTVFRHFDNATVRAGFVGTTPRTAWLLDYPIFERIYYNLVAGFDVFGNVTHQVATRLYMDHLRMEAEENFLLLLPAHVRREVASDWYEGATDQLDRFRTKETSVAGHDTQIRYRTDDPKTEVLEMIARRTPAIAGSDWINRCPEAEAQAAAAATGRCLDPEATPLEARAEQALRALSGVRGPWVATLPELTFVRVTGTTPAEARLYTLVRDAYHRNVAFMFDEEDRRVPENDELTVVRGSLGSYPKFLFDVPAAQVGAFVAALRAVEDAAGFERLADRFGVRRTSAHFWATVDWLHDDFRKREPTEAGLFDLNRYENR